MCDSHGRAELYMDKLHEEITDARKVIASLMAVIATRVPSAGRVKACREVVEGFYEKHGQGAESLGEGREALNISIRRTKEDWAADFEQLCRSEQSEVLASWEKRARALGVKVSTVSEPLVEHAWGVRALVLDHYEKVLSTVKQDERRKMWDADLDVERTPATDRVLFDRDEVLDLMEQVFQDGLLAGAQQPDANDRSSRKKGT